MFYQFMSLFPKNLESYVFGCVTRVRLPKPMSKSCNKMLVKMLKIDMSDAAKNIEEYKNFEELFTRELKANSRAIQGPLCSPCDGVWSRSQPVDRGTAIQAKKLSYSVQEFLFPDKVDKDFNPSWYMNFYLAPHNYHRVHAPFAGELHSVCYVPGKLWPVNEKFVTKVPHLYCQNERVVMELRGPQGAKAYLVMIGALHVGRIQVKGFEDIMTNTLKGQFLPQKPRYVKLSKPRSLSAGDELGTFMLGSSVVMIFDDAFSQIFDFKRSSQKNNVLMGESLLS